MKAIRVSEAFNVFSTAQAHVMGTIGESISYFRNSPLASKLVFQANKIWTPVNITNIRKN